MTSDARQHSEDSLGWNTNSDRSIRKHSTEYHLCTSSSEIVIAYRFPQTLQAGHLGLPIDAMVAIGGGMGHFMNQELRHDHTASVVTEKSDEDLATREVNKTYRLASRREERRISHRF